MKDLDKELEKILKKPIYFDADCEGYATDKIDSDYKKVIVEEIKTFIRQREKELLLLLLDLEKRGHDLKSTIELQLKGDIYKTDE